VAGPALQEGGRFQGITLRSETQRLLGRKVLSRDAQARLNRRLLEDAFPAELVPLRPAWVVTLTATVVTIAVGGLVGWINGMTIAVFRMMPFIVTLGMMGVVRGAAKWMGKNQTVNPPGNPVNDLMALADPQKLFPLPLGVWVAVALAVVMAVVLRQTVFGRYIFAIGSNEATARLCGIRVPRQKVLIYSLAGLFFGLAGLMQFSRLTQGDPSVAIGLELDIIAAVVIGGASLSGGTGSIVGSMIGAFMMAVLRNGSNQMGWPTYMQEIIIGIVIVLAVGLDKWRQARMARRTG
jgi:ribose transport system permease protein